MYQREELEIYTPPSKDEIGLKIGGWLDGRFQGDMDALNYGPGRFQRVTEKSDLYPIKRETERFKEVNVELQREAKEGTLKNEAGEAIKLNQLARMEFGTGSIEKLVAAACPENKNRFVLLDTSPFQLNTVVEDIKARREEIRAAGKELTVRPFIADMFEPGDYGNGPFFGLWTGFHSGNVVWNPNSPLPPVEPWINRLKAICRNLKGGPLLFSYLPCLDPDKLKNAYEENKNFPSSFLNWEVQRRRFPKKVRDSLQPEEVVTLWTVDHKPVMGMVSHYAKVTKSIKADWLFMSISLKKGDRLLISSSAQARSDIAQKMAEQVGHVVRHWPEETDPAFMLLDPKASHLLNEGSDLSKSFALTARDVQLPLDYDPNRPIIHEVPYEDLDHLLKNPKSFAAHL